MQVDATFMSNTCSVDSTNLTGNLIIKNNTNATPNKSTICARLFFAKKMEMTICLHQTPILKQSTHESFWGLHKNMFHTFNIEGERK